MANNIKFMAILFAFVMQSMAMWASISNGFQVYFQYRGIKKTGGISLPSRAPAKHELTLNAFYDDANQQLALTDPSNGIYSYSIYDEDEEIMSQGTLSFNNGDILYIDLGGYQSGVYSLEIIYGGSIYLGTFEIE